MQDTLTWLTENADRYGFQKGYVFGSVTVPNRFTEWSDIDVAVETHKVGNVCGLMGALSWHVEREVDMVPLERCHFAEKIRSEGVTWTANKLPE